MKKQIVKLACIAAAMIGAEQLIKLAIVRWFMYETVTLIPGMLWFSPMQNTKLSWFGSLGIPLFDQLWFNLLFGFLALYFVVMSYLYAVRRMGVRSRYANLSFLLIFSGAVCSLIDTTLWGGSIDYIRLFNWFTFDLKDVYISSFCVLLVLGSFLFSKRLDQLRARDWLRYCFAWK